MNIVILQCLNSKCNQSIFKLEPKMCPFEANNIIFACNRCANININILLAIDVQILIFPCLGY